MSSSPGVEEAEEASEGIKVDVDGDEEEEGIDYSLKFKEEQGMSTSGPVLQAGSSHDGGEAGIKEDDHEDVKPADGTDESGCYFLRQKCQICGSPAANHLHYGAFCCYSCRAFFRRSGERTYKCSSGNNNCKVENNTRKACKKCRYRLCLEAGMKPSLVDRHVKKKKVGEEENSSQNLKPMKLKLKSKLVNKMRTQDVNNMRTQDVHMRTQDVHNMRTQDVLKKRADQAGDQKSDGSPTAVSPFNPLQDLHSKEIKLEEDLDGDQGKDTSGRTNSRGASLEDMGVDIKDEDTSVEQPIEVSKGESPPSIWSKPNLWNRVLSNSPDQQKALQNFLSPKTSTSPIHLDIKPKSYSRPSPTTSPFQILGFPSSPQSSSLEIMAPLQYSSRQSQHIAPSHSRTHKRQGSSQSPQASPSHYHAAMQNFLNNSPQISPPHHRATIQHGFPKSPQISPSEHQVPMQQGFSRSPQISPQYPPSPPGQGYRPIPHVSSAQASMRIGYSQSPQLSPSLMQSSVRHSFQPQTSPSQAYAQMFQGLGLKSPTLNQGLLRYGFQLSPENSTVQAETKSQLNLHQSPHSSTSYPIFNDRQSQHDASSRSPQGSSSGSPPSPNHSFQRCYRPPLGQLSPTLGMPLSPSFFSNRMGAPSAIQAGYPRLPNPNHFPGQQGVQSRALQGTNPSTFLSSFPQYPSDSRVSPTVSRGVEVIKKARISVICGPRRSSDKIVSNPTAAEVEETRIQTMTESECALLKKIMAQQEKHDVIEEIETNNNTDMDENPMDLLKSIAARDLPQIPDSPILKFTLEEQKQCRYFIWTWESAHIGVDKIRTDRVEIERDMEPDYVKNKEASDIRQSIKEYFDEQDSENSFNTFFSNQNNHNLLHNRLQCNILLGISCRMYGGDDYVFYPDLPEAKERFWRKYSYLLRSPWASSMQEEDEIRNIMLETAALLAKDRVIEVLFTNCVISGFTTGYEQQEVNLASLGIEDDVYPRNQTLLLFRYLKYKEGEEKSKVTFRTLKNLVPKLERAVTIFFENRLMI